MGARARSRRWLWWAVAGALAALGYVILPATDQARPLLYGLVSLITVLALLLGIRINRPTHTATWYLLAASKVLWLVGMVTFSRYSFTGGEHPLRYRSDVFVLSSYLVLMVALLILIRSRSPARDFAPFLDAAIVGTGTGVLLWVLLISPIVATAPSGPALLVALAYPVADVLILVLLGRLATTPGERSPSYWLLFGGQAGLLGSDIAYSVVTTYGLHAGWPIEAGWLLSSVLTAAAVLHPSVRNLAEPADEDAGSFTVRRIAMLAVFIMVPPAVLVLEGLIRPERIDWLPISAGMALLSVLALARANGLIARISFQANRLDSLAMHDALTGLPNRRLFELTVGAALAQKRPVQVGLVDLDDFKAVNDRLGHTAGDRLLVEVGQLLRERVRGDDLVARLGGDEFVVARVDGVQPEQDGPWQRIVHALRAPIEVDGHRLLIRASVGLADGAGTREPLEVVRRADIAMYAAKEAGGDRVQRYGLALDQRATEHALLGEQLRRAADRGELWLAYQPIVSLPDGSLVAVEALLRWNHPDLGQVPPDRFIPVAEHAGVIEDMGAWVLHEACRQLAVWDAGFGPDAPPRISVNVSARQLIDTSLPETIAAALARNGIAADRLTVEVTETAVFGGGRAIETLYRLRALGVQIALDDFGTGSSSLGLLLTCPVQVLKVDKSFVDDIVLRSRNAAIAASLIAVSEGLGLVAVAEGVETADQANTLFEFGYRFAQGFYFGRPLDPDGIGTLIGGDPGVAPVERRIQAVDDRLR